MTWEFEQWCSRMERQVRFFPDRKAIRRELTDHYWDHVEDLRRIGYEDALARQRALRAMGDPAKVTDYEPEGPAFLGPESPLWESVWQRTDLLAGIPEPWENGDYVLTAPYAAVWREERQDGAVYHWLSVILRAEKRRFWDEDLSLVPLTVTDSTGQRYVTAHWEEDSPVCDVNWNNPEHGLTFCTYHLNVPLESGDVEWVELGYLLNEAFSIRLQFREVTP